MTDTPDQPLAVAAEAASNALVTLPPRDAGADRAVLFATLAAWFPEARARGVAFGGEPGPSDIEGRMEAAEARLAGVDPPQYGRTRNHVDGKVTRLSMYLRHGVLDLAEVRDRVLAMVAKPDKAYKLVNELAWRDYWQRVYAEIGDGVWEDLEPYKTGFHADEYADTLPEDIPEGRTGLACMDGFADELRRTGYLHNHIRMWVAAYVVHWRRVKWHAGAEWFLVHLLDGDPASNNLSWQWVASTFSHKPYMFNRGNLEKYTDGRYCTVCPHADTYTCPFQGSYGRLSADLFPHRDDTRGG